MADDEEAGAAHKGWMIQIGVTDNAAKANALLDRARDATPRLGRCEAITEKVQQGGDLLYRARFAGLDPTSAESSVPLAQDAMDSPASPPMTDAGTFDPRRPFSARSASALSLHQNILGLIDPRGESGRAAMIWMKLLHQRSRCAATISSRPAPFGRPRISYASSRDIGPPLRLRRPVSPSLCCASRQPANRRSR